MDLSQLLNLDQVQQETQKRYSDALREKRQYQDISKKAGQNFAGALSSENPIALNPADVFNSYETFNSAVSPKLTADQDILSQIAQIAKDRKNAEGSGVSVSDQLKALELGYEIKDGQVVQREGGTLTKTQEADLLKLRQQRIEAGLDTKDIDTKLGLDKKIGEDEVFGVSLIDEILNSKTAGLTGILRGKLSTTGLFSPYKTADAKAKVEQLSGILQLASAGKLKGQGTVTENERKILKDAVSALGLDEKGETRLSDADFRKELTRIQTALAKKSNDPKLVEKYGTKTDEKDGFDANEILDKYGY